MFNVFIQHKLQNNNKYKIGDIIQYTEGDDRDKCILVLENGDFKQGEMDLKLFNKQQILLKLLKEI